MEKEFLALAETEGIADIEELNKILERAVNLKNFLKGKERVKQGGAAMWRSTTGQNVEPLGYKAFLVGVDREACAFYKEALDKILPPEYSEIVYTGNNNDPAAPEEVASGREAREGRFARASPSSGELPKILIVTEKLLTGFDAPILYAMYLDKPMRDHTLLQAIARVNRPYENEAAGDGEAAWLRARFRRHLRQAGKGAGLRQRRNQRHRQRPRPAQAALQGARWKARPRHISALVHRNFDDKDVDNLIEHFRDKDRRKEFFKEYKEIEMLYEIISPDAFLRPFLDDYTTFRPSTQWCAMPTPGGCMSTVLSRKRRTSWSSNTSAPFFGARAPDASCRPRSSKLSRPSNCNRRRQKPRRSSI